MIRKAIALAVLSTLTVAPHHHAAAKTAPAPHIAVKAQLVDATTMRKWSRVYICETHNWAQRGHYAGGLGITQWNWEHHGGLRFARAPYLANPEQQVYVATVIQHGLPVPDQTSTCKDW